MKSQKNKIAKLFKEQINQKFGSYFGSRKDALESLGLQRRIFNMYLSGERNIPPHVWARLRKLPNHNANQLRLPLPYLDDTDPLS
jgi:hypothetical protein